MSEPRVGSTTVGDDLLQARETPKTENRADAAVQVLEHGEQIGLSVDLITQLERALQEHVRVSYSPEKNDINELLDSYNKGQWEVTEKRALELTAKHPKHPFGWKVLGAVFMATGRNEQALAAMRQSLVLGPHDAEAHNNLGLLLKDLGQFAEAEANYRRAIQLQPVFPEAHNNLGVLLKDLGQVDEAQVSYGRAIQLRPDFAEGHSNLGMLLKELRRHTEAEISYRQAISLKPGYSEAHNNLGVLLKDLGRLAEAEASYRQAIQLKPHYAEAHSNLGVILQILGRSDEAEASYRQAILLKPDLAELHYNLGVTLKDLGRLKDAEASYRRAIQLKPEYAEVRSNLGVILQDLGRLEEAEVSYRQAILSKPELAEAHYNLGNTLKALDRLEEAEASYREAIRLQLEFAQAHSNLGVILQDLGRLREAEACYCLAIRYKPDFAEAYSNLGNILKDLGRMEKAEACYRHAMRLNLHSAEVQFNLSLLLLLCQKIEEGLCLYEQRWDGARKPAPLIKRNFAQPLWLGEAPLTGKTILIHAEQGLGDTIQFCRYVKAVKGLGARVIFEVQSPLMPLLADLEGVDVLIQTGQPLPNFDYHCPLLSLPFAFKTDIDSIPAPIPYLRADPKRVQRWDLRLGKAGFKIGICWEGAKSIKGRSIPIECFDGLSRMPGVRLISLHKGEGEKDLACLPHGMTVETLGAEFDCDAAFVDTAAVMKCCDLVITNDTSVAHLAGASGLSTWVALKFVPDWRWMLDRSDSPWYPTMTLFRQKRIGDWAPVFSEMQLALRSKLAGFSKRTQ